MEPDLAYVERCPTVTIAPNSGSPGSAKQVKCYRCKNMGHYANNCPDKYRKSSLKCNRCGEVGVTTDRCTKCKVPGNGGASQ